MQSAVVYGLSKSVEESAQQTPFNCPSGNCTWDPFESLAICSACTDLSINLTKNGSEGGLWYVLDEANGVALGAKEGGTTFSLPNGLFIDNVLGFDGVN